MHVVHYWKALGKPVPNVSAFEIEKLLRDFDNILFAWRRLNFQNPQFPYTYLMVQIVSRMSRYSPAMHQLIKFLRVLKCKKRRKRYDDLFNKCLCLAQKKCDVQVVNETSDGDDNDDESTDSIISGSTHSISNEDALHRIISL